MSHLPSVTTPLPEPVPPTYLGPESELLLKSKELLAVKPPFEVIPSDELGPSDNWRAPLTDDPVTPDHTPPGEPDIPEPTVPELSAVTMPKPESLVVSETCPLELVPPGGLVESDSGLPVNV